VQGGQTWNANSRSIGKKRECEQFLIGERGGQGLEARGGSRGDPPQNRGFKTEDLSGRVDLGGREQETCFKSSCCVEGPLSPTLRVTTYPTQILCVVAGNRGFEWGGRSRREREGEVMSERACERKIKRDL